MMIEDQDNDIDGDDGLYEHYRFVTPGGLKPVRVDKYIQMHLEGVSRNKIQNGLRAGSIRVDDQEIKPNFILKPSQTITIFLPKPPNLGDRITPEDIPLDIRYEDEDLMVICKPAGLVVHPGISHDSGTLVNALAHHLRMGDMPVMEGNSPDRPGLVHRIDKDTSGLLLIAKNDFAMTHLAKQFFDHSIKREYNAIVWGAPDPPAGTIEGHIGRDPRFRLLMTVFPDGEEGKESITHYETLEDLYYVSLVKCTLETGRTHQIRVHMRYIGHPVFSDARYGGDRIVKGTVFTKYRQFVDNCFGLCPRQALHARTLGFIHPRTGKQMFFESELPDDMTAVLNKWRAYVSHKKENLN